MTFNPETDHRRSIRLKGYDYSLPGAYFLTICSYEEKCVFGEINKRGMRLNSVGKAVQKCWDEIPSHFPNVSLDEFVIMPNHLHGVVIIGAETKKGTACRAPTKEMFGKPMSGSLPTIVRSFKSAATRRVNLLKKIRGTTLWQSNYYEHIIRNEKELLNIRNYIYSNPKTWEQHSNNPANV